ncbi:hypothetical protein Tco_0711745 [Tanacetum coccineum]
MIAYLEKSAKNDDFDEIVDFLNASTIRYALTSSGPTIPVADETIHEERDDSVERVATTVASLDAMLKLLEIQKLKEKFQEDSETQGRYGHGIGVNTASISITIASINITTAKPVITASAPLTTAGVSVITAEPSTPPPTTTITTL